MSGLAAVVLAGGLVGTIGQLLMLRELLTLLHGNELILAAVLCSWLMLAAAGAWLGRGQQPGRAAGRRLAWLATLLALLPPLQLIGTRLARGALFLPGSSLGLVQTLAFGVLAMAPAAMLVGLFFPVALAAARQYDPRVSGARIYWLDALGSTLGGALFSIVLVRALRPLLTAALAGAILLVCLLAALWHGPLATRGERACAAAAMLLICVLLATAPWLERATLAPPRGMLREVRETPFGRIAVVEDRGQVTLFADGVPLLSSQELQSAEERAHYPLIQVEQPRRVLAIGSIGGLLEELAKHGVQRIEQVELNPALSELERRYALLPPVAGLELLHTDARHHLMRSSRPYDAILINLPPPETFQLNRYYTSEFFALCRQHLSPGGVLAFALPGFANYLSDEGRAALAMAAASARRHFAHVLALPGESVMLLCANSALGLDIPARLSQRGIATEYIHGQFAGDVTAERLAALQALLDPAAPENRDDRPRLVALLQGWWLARSGADFWPLAAILAAALSLGLARARADSTAIFATGAAAMGWEVLLIFAFQLAHGYLYQALGLIVSACLAGLPLGAAVGRRLRWPAARKTRLLACDLGVSGMTWLLLALLWLAPGGMGLGICLVSGFAICLAAGAQFAVTLQLRGEGGADAGGLYAADLWGAACGALLSAVAIPWLGLRAVAAAIALCKGASVVRLMWQERHATT